MPSQPRRPASRGSQICLLAGLFAYLLALIFYRLAEFPGLHGDEAWMGLLGFQIQRQGFYTPHGMHPYTGSIYGWLLAKVFSLMTPGVFSLRLPGAVLNAAAAGIVAAYFFRRFGFATALAWFYLLGSSSLFLFKARVAWEVYALQNFLLSIILVTGHRMLEGKGSSWDLPLFLYANYIGVFNHFIFLSVPLSLAVTLTSLALFQPDGRWSGFLGVCLANLGATAALYLLKPAIGESFWRSHGVPLGIVLALLPGAAAAVYGASRERLGSVIEDALAAGLVRRRAPGALKALLLLGLGLFFLFHLTPMLEAWSNVVIFQRMASWTPPLAASIVLHIWAAALLGIFFVSAYRELEGLGRPASGESPGERFLLLWPLVYAACFILSGNVSTIRYYIIPSFLVAAALARLLARFPGLRPPPVLAAGLGVTLLLQVFFWREAGFAHERRPMELFIGRRRERSSDFMSKEALYRVLERERVCRLDNKNTFIDLPLIFLLNVQPFECDHSRSIAVEYCRDCAAPPYFRWKIAP